MSTRSQIRALLRDFISQEDTANTDFTNAELDGYLDLGNRFLGALVKHPRDLIEVQAEQGVPSYTLPTDAIIIRTAYFGDVDKQGDIEKLNQLTEEALAEVDPNWLDETATSQGRPRRIILQDRSTILVHPSPDAEQSATGKKIRLGYVFQPAVMTTDADIPEIPLVYHDFIAEYAFYLACIGKLNLFEKGQSVLKTVVDKAKRLESLIVKDTEGSLGFTWGRFATTDDRDGLVLRP